LERLLNFWIFETYLMKILHPVQSREPPKVKKLKIGVVRKFDLIEPNWVYSFSSIIRLYQTRIVSPVLVLGCWTVFYSTYCLTPPEIRYKVRFSLYFSWLSVILKTNILLGFRVWECKWNGKKTRLHFIQFCWLASNQDKNLI
jgi:hypothetical protein